MIRVIINGCNGHMGQVLIQEINKDREMTITAGIDRYTNNNNDFTVLTQFNNLKEKADIIIDFSHPSSLPDLLDYSIRNHVPLVIATTGFTAHETEMIKTASEMIPIFYSANMSLGINVLLNLAKKASKTLNDSFDIEIIEKHHNKKIDAPSGTAFILAEGINEELNNSKSFKFGRKTSKNRRDKIEIGIHAVRGGTIVGEHQVIFAGVDEIIELTHKASSKKIFAVGAIKAAKFLLSKNNGLYGMTDLLD